MFAHLGTPPATEPPRGPFGFPNPTAHRHRPAAFLAPTNLQNRMHLDRDLGDAWSSLAIRLDPAKQIPVLIVMRAVPNHLEFYAFIHDAHAAHLSDIRLTAARYPACQPSCRPFRYAPIGVRFKTRAIIMSRRLWALARPPIDPSAFRDCGLRAVLILLAQLREQYR